VGLATDDDVNAGAVADALIVAVGLLHRRLRQAPVEGELPLPQRAALARLGRGGPMSSAELARLEQISPQSMGSTLAALESRGLVERRSDPADGRRIVMSLTAAGEESLRDRRSARIAQLAAPLGAEFSRAELKRLAAVAPLIERLAERL
jgi:DNA-binding MarR family transcriptional regulator